MALFINNKYPHQDSYHFDKELYDIIAHNDKELPTAFENIQKAQDLGYYLVGYLSYELGYFFEPSLAILLRNTAFKTPLLHFRAFKSMNQFLYENNQHRAIAQKKLADNQSFFSNIKLNISCKEYRQKIQELKKHFFNGESYQTNFTSFYYGNWQGNPEHLFYQLLDKQCVEYAAFLPNFKEVNILSISPELFFKKQGNIITCKPMKGTAKRLQEIEDDLRQQFYLQSDPKIHAENTMIVDLLRNDLGRIAEPGSVEVTQLLTCEHYATLHQMTSTITAKLATDITFEKIIQGLFPCGSITGAPKIRTMQIIHQLENRQRGIYTGAIGYITPENNMCFNVAIRTAELSNNNNIVLGIGGGILYDSDINDEFEEIKLKAKFLLDISK